MTCYAQQKIYRYALTIVCVLFVGSLLLIGCDKREQTQVMSNELYAQVGFEIVAIDAITNKTILEWIDQNYVQQGIYTLDIDQWGQSATYILIAEGEKPTGGYAIQVERLEGHSEEIRVVSTLREPKKGDSVTQSFTYPYIVLKIEKEERKIVLDK